MALIFFVDVTIILENLDGYLHTTSLLPAKFTIAAGREALSKVQAGNIRRHRFAVADRWRPCRRRSVPVEMDVLIRRARATSLPEGDSRLTQVTTAPYSFPFRTPV